MISDIIYRDIISGVASGITISIIVGVFTAIAAWVRSRWLRRKAVRHIRELLSKFIHKMNEPILTDRDKCQFYNEIRPYFLPLLECKDEHLSSSQKAQLANAFYLLELKKGWRGAEFISKEDLSEFVDEIEKIDFLKFNN